MSTDLEKEMHQTEEEIKETEADLQELQEKKKKLQQKMTSELAGLLKRVRHSSAYLGEEEVWAAKLLQKYPGVPWLFILEKLLEERY